MTLLNSQQSLTQLAQTSSTPLTVSGIKAPPPRSLTTTVPAVHPGVTQDQATMLVLPINIQTRTEMINRSKQCITITFLSSEGHEEDRSTDGSGSDAHGDHRPVGPTSRCATFS